jgi:hydrogenase maturation protease
MTPQPYDLLDDGFEPPHRELVVIGCGNLLRGDDGVGPIAIRRLWARGVPDEVRLVDGGTAGLDVAFQMRGARRVIVIDAAITGAAPGTLFRVPGEQLEQDLMMPNTVHPHSVRWDHALALGRWLLGPGFPADVEVLLVEACSLEPGAELSDPVASAMEQVIKLILSEFEAIRARA